MANSMFGSLLNMLDKRSVGDVANALGQPEEAVARGMESSVASLMGGLASKSGDPGILRKLLDTVSGTSGTVSWSQIAGSLVNPNSSLMDTGKRLLPALFGSSEQTVTNAISREAGLSSGAITTLLTMAAPVVMSFISKQVRDGGMTMSGLGNLLQRESSTIRNALPSGLSEIFWPAATTTTTTTSTASPVIAQSVQKEKSVSWLPIAASAALGLGLFWFLGQGHRPPIQTVVTPIPTGSANRYAIPAPRKLCSVPDNANIPENGSAARLLAFAQNPDNRAAAAGWLNIDQMAFATGSATLQPASARQLNTIATVMTNCPSVHLEIAGYTDNVGSGDANLRLSRNRANAVVAQLVKEGVPRDRLMARGFGEEYPQADNATAEGRAENRRVAMKVIQK